MTSLKEDSEEYGIYLGGALAFAFGFFLRVFFFFGSLAEGPSPIEEALVVSDASVSDFTQREGRHVGMFG